MASIKAPDAITIGQPMRLDLKDVQSASQRLALWSATGASGRFDTIQPQSVGASQPLDDADHFVARANWIVTWTPDAPADDAVLHARIYKPKAGESLTPADAIGDHFTDRYEFIEAADHPVSVDIPQALMAMVMDRGRDAKPTVSVTLEPAGVEESPYLALWSAIRQSTEAISFTNYARFMDIVLCGADPRELDSEVVGAFERVGRRLRLPFPDTDAYRQLKVATEVFMMLHCGVDFGTQPERSDVRLIDKWGIGLAGIQRLWGDLVEEGSATAPDSEPTILYLALVRNKLRGVDIVADDDLDDLVGEHRLGVDQAAAACYGILRTKLTRPCFIELLHEYWHEEALIAQTMNAISWRFQNRRGHGDRDPLALLEIDPLRPLNNFIWGWVQDEQHRLSVVRRAYEYDHHYGITLLGNALPQVRGADSRTQFIEAFHHLLYLCSIFFKEEDDTTVIADGFTVLNALKEVHLLLTQGAHNQYGDLPWTARQEMLMQQWLLARPEFREFLPRRIMVDYPEEWMDSVETMKTMQGWQSASVLHFRDLGLFGERILLGIRFGAWPSIADGRDGANWARYWRPEIQGYIHAYRAVTGVELAEQPDSTMPAFLLQQRMAAQLPAAARARLPMRVSVVERPALPMRRTR
jgi:hypothetical protein